LGANPNPKRISAELWKFWEWFDAYEPQVEYGGTFADKPGYHNAPENLPRTDYSLAHANDKAGPHDKCAAIDLTFKDAKKGDFKTIKKYAKRLLKSGKDTHDERGNYLREFFGQADADRGVEGWDFQAVARRPLTLPTFGTCISPLCVSSSMTRRHSVPLSRF
jgi:hypothetical protein